MTGRTIVPMPRVAVYYGKNAVLVVEISLHQGSDLPQVAQVFCRFCALKSTIKGWNEDRGEMPI